MGRYAIRRIFEHRRERLSTWKQKRVVNWWCWICSSFDARFNARVDRMPLIRKMNVQFEKLRVLGDLRFGTALKNHEWGLLIETQMGEKLMQCDLPGQFNLQVIRTLSNLSFFKVFRWLLSSDIARYILYHIRTMHGAHLWIFTASYLHFLLVIFIPVFDANVLYIVSVLAVILTTQTTTF